MTRLGEGFEPVAAARQEGPITGMLKEQGIKTYILPERGFLGSKYVARFIKIIRTEGIQIIHLNTLTPFCKHAAIAGFLMRVPIVWVVRENPLISRSRRLRFWMKLLASRILFVDNDTREKLLPDTPGAEVIYNGVDLNNFRPFQSDLLFEMTNISRDELLIGYIGLITKRKGLEYLIRALPDIKKGYDKFKLVIIGDNRPEDRDYFSDIKGLIKELSLESDVFFTGVLSDVKGALNSLDIVMLPSLEERCSRALLEALACAKPVVATRVGGTPEIIKDGLNGFLVEPENEKQIAEAVLKLLLDNDLRQEMSVNGRAYAEKYFDIQKNIQRMREIYTDLECSR
jgi:L-malate glycosyltransferase